MAFRIEDAPASNAIEAALSLSVEILEDHLSGRYRIEREIGRGGMGVVYLAEDLRHRRAVAIKIFRSDVAVTLGAERFLREIEISARLQHPYILPLYDSGDAGGILYYVMPFIDGESLGRRLAREKQLSVDDAVRIAAETVDALADAHQHGVVHRDIKPDNILLSGGHVRVADFGIARALHEAAGGALTQTGFALGTPAYMSPEQAAADTALDGRSDVYSLGCVLFEMLAGHPPFTGPDPRTVLARHAHDPVPPLRSVRAAVTPEVEAIVRRALAKAPADRYATATEMALALARLGERTAGPAPSGRLRVGKRMLAVLPFENLSSDPEQEYFSDGLTEEMIAGIGRVDPRRLGVIARTSVMGYKKSGKTAHEIGLEMRVDYLLEGSVRRAGNRVRVTAKLIQVQDQTQVWMSHYDGDLTEIFEVQTDVADRVARSLALELLPDDSAAARPATRNPAAYELYLRACHLFGRGTDEARREALARFHETIALDPEYALAHARLANCYLSLAADNVLAPDEAYAHAKTAARRALDLDETLAPAHAHLALIAMAHEWEWQEAQAGFRRAVDLDPNSAYAHGLYSTFLAAVGRVDDAVGEARRALELDPRSAGRSLTVGTRLLFARRYEAAIEQFRRTLELDPEYDVAHYYMGKALLEMGRHEESIAELERVYAASGSPTDLAELARARAKAGDGAGSRAALSQLATPGAGTYVSPTDLAKVYEALGEREAALDELEKALEVKASDVVFLRVDPDWDGLRAEPRFQELLRRVGLPESDQQLA